MGDCTLIVKIKKEKFTFMDYTGQREHQVQMYERKKALVDLVAGNHVWECAGCGKSFNNAREITIDHIVPFVYLKHYLGYTKDDMWTDVWNLQLMCSKCNSTKHHFIDFKSEKSLENLKRYGIL